MHGRLSTSGVLPIFALASVLGVILLLTGCGTPTPFVATPTQPRVASAPTRSEQIREDSRPIVISKDEFWEDLPPGIVNGRSHFEATDVTEWTFANGMRVILRSSQSEPRRVFLLAFAEGGLVDVDSDRAASAILAAHARGSEMNPGGIRVESFFTSDLAILAGDASTESLGSLLQRATAQMAASDLVAENPTLHPEEAFSLLVSGHPETSLASPFDRSAAVATYAEQFGDPRRFTYVIVGDVLPSEVEAQTAIVLTSTRPSAQAALGSQESRQPIQPLDRVADWTMGEAGEQASFNLGFRGSMDASYENLAALEIAGELLNQRIETTTGKAVIVDVEMDFENNIAELRLTATSSGVDGESFRTAVFDVLQSLRETEPSTQLFAEARSAVLDAYEQSILTNAGWLHWLVRLFRYDHDTREALRYGQRIRATAASRVRDVAIELLAPDRYALVIQRGE